MKIAIFTDTYAPEINGVCNTLLRLTEYFRAHNIEYLVVAPEYPDDLPAGTGSATNIIRVKSVRAPFYPQSRLALPSYAYLRQRLEAFQPDIVHVTTPLTIGWSGHKFARESSLPLVISYHTNFDQYLTFYKLEYLRNWLNRYMYWFHREADLILAPSKETQQSLIYKGYQNVGIWSRGIDCFTFRPHSIAANTCPPEPFTFLYVGRLSAEKQLDVLLDAIEIVNRTCEVNTRFIFTGDGPLRETMETRQLANLAFTGFLSGEQLANVYRSAHCFVSPSSSETFGNVMLEAMASGLPVICADRGGQLDFARNGYNSLHFRADCADSLAKTIMTAIDNPPYIQQLAMHARATATERTWDSIFARLLNDYEQVIQTKTRLFLPA
jgi:glycosyltransferase involved in cell wall biosynthesis